MYKLSENSIIRTTDGASIPADPANTDYAAYLRWVEKGNTPEPADLPDPKEAIKAQIATLEATITPRRLRESLLTGDKTFIEGVESQIAALRGQL